MPKLSIPITLPYGISGNIENFRKTKFKIEVDKLRDLSKHKKTSIEYGLDIDSDHHSLLKFGEIDHAALKIPPPLLHNFASRHSNRDNNFTLNVNLYTDVKNIAKEYSCPEDIYQDIIFYLTIFLQGIFNVGGFSRFSPIIIINDKQIMFNARLAYLLNPWQDWFCDPDTLKILFDKSLKHRVGSGDKHYETILPHVENEAKVLNLDKLSTTASYPAYAIDDILVFGRVLSEIIRLHPSYDYSAIVGLLTALIEGLLKINGENRYKFKIKISNLLKDDSLGQALNKIYDSRSAFFHSARFYKLNDIFEILTIEFLLVIVRKIIRHSADSEIAADTFDFSS